MNRSARGIVCFWASVAIGTASWFLSLAPVNVSESASSGLSQHPGELAIKPSDEPFSVPETGSSLFDKVFSQKNQAGVREYVVPYPFTKMIQRLQEASGGVGPRMTLFPMGRSLQRSAAVEGMKNVPNLDPFYRFPRMVLGFDQESKNPNGRLSMNLKGRLYIGMNEKASLLEVISYNDEAGRFEYQVVRDYDGKQSPQVLYASRQLCLSCHQNQTPIFSRAPWSESNANPAMQEGLTRVLRQTFGDGSNCEQDPHAIFCHRDLPLGRSYYYSGAPVAVDQEVPYAIDQTVRQVNYFPAYHKMWQRLCADLECRRDLLKQIFIYKLTGGTGLLQTPDVAAFNRRLQEQWNKEFPNGMKIPESAIPNRDPLLNHKDRGQGDTNLVTGRPSDVKTDLQQVLANTDVPGEFEPLLARDPSEIWSSPFLNSTLSHLLVGYAEFFTTADARLIDDILVTTPLAEEFFENIPAACKWKRGSNAQKPDFSLTCALGTNGRGLQFSTFIRIPPGLTDLLGSSRSIRAIPPSSNCNPAVPATPENLMNGQACPQVDNAITRLRQVEGGWQIFFQAQSGLSLRFMDARRLAPVVLPDLSPGETKELTVPFRLARDAGPLLAAQEKAFASVNEFKKYVDGPALNRHSVMNLLMNFLGRPSTEFATLTKEMQSLKKQSEAPEDELKELPLKPSERAVALSSRSCATCHFNREGVPPNYLGGPGDGLTIEDKCRRVSACSARMLYRLKMWDCEEGLEFEIKKTPMPPISRMKALNMDMAKWKKTDRAQLFNSLLAVFPQQELQNLLVLQGVPAPQAQAFLKDLTQLGCPKEMSTMFEKLPRCDQSFAFGASLCR